MEILRKNIAPAAFRGYRYRTTVRGTEIFKRMLHCQDDMKQPFTRREEANAITCCAFRNGFLEELHAGKSSELLNDPQLSRITDTEIKRLMIESSEVVAELLEMKDENPEKYWKLIARFNEVYCRQWEKHPEFKRRLNRSKPIPGKSDSERA